MKKRFLSIVLAVLMLVSVLPVTAMAADGTTDTGAEGTQTAVGAVSTDGAIHVNKSVVTDAETGKTSLELEAFATNTVSTETTYDPLDIVLVLDVSGSMDDNKITSYKYTETKKDEWSCDDIYKSSVYYYYKDSEGYYRRVDWDSEGGGWFSGPYRCWITAGGTRIGNKVSNWNDVSYRGKLYTRTNEGSVTRMAAMQAAVNAFIDNVAAQKDSKGKAIENHISIVKFAGKMQTPNQYKVGNNTYKEDGYTYNYSQIVKDMTDVSTGSAALKAAVNSLKAGGATSADYGMQLASHVLSQHKDNPVRRSVVIMFTDGEPNHSRDFDEDVAKDAIAAAKGLKEKNTVVFTIGIFNGANPNASVTSNNTSDTNKYMHAVSSNYPGAAYIKTEDLWSTSWDWSFGERAKDSNYYLAASNAADLEDIFVEISNEVNSLAVKIDATSVLSDTLSGAFDFNAPENAEYSGITVAKYPVTGMENGVYTWGAAQELAIGEGEGKVQVEVAGKKLEVTGFDYGANAVTTKTEGETTTYSGYKLVVTIPIKPDTEYHGWADGANYYDTNSTANGSKAGLEYGETGSRQKLELNDSPEAPVTGYTVSYAYKTGTKPDNADALLPSSSVHIEGQEYNLETTPSADGWTFTGWLDSSDKEVTGKQTMGTVPVTYYGKWTFEADEPEITEAGYTVEYYRQNADGENYTLQEDTDSGVAEIGKEKTIEPAEDKYSGYTYNETKSIVTLTIQEEAGKNVFKVYYDAVPRLEVTKTITDVTRDGERLDPTDPEVEVKEGDVIEYEITVRNSGKLNLTDVVLTDEFTGAEGDLTFISGDDYTVDGYEITLKNDLNVGDSVTIKATYEVQLGDSGYEITNKASGTAKDALKREVTGESRPVGITPDALKAYWIFGSAYKYVKSKKGTFNKDGETVPFEFKVTSDKKGEEILDTFTIDVEETVKAGETSCGETGYLRNVG